MPFRPTRLTRRRFLAAAGLAGLGVFIARSPLRHLLMTGLATFPVSDHCDGRRFFNPRHHINRSWYEVMRWKRTARPGAWPSRVDITPQPAPAAPAAGVTVSLVNHCTFLIRTPTLNILTDPVYSDRIGPFGLVGPVRVHAPGIAFDDLPRIDVVLLSHDHYDHCDIPTLEKLARRDAPLALAPLGNGPLFRAAGFAPDRIVTLDWWDERTPNDDLRVTLTPARHWSNRLSGPRNGRLWGGFHLRTAGRSVFFAGDTGYDPHIFREIGRRLGPPDLALIPIGDYEPRWFMQPQHCDPAEAVKIHRALAARRGVGMHWGTFQLADNGRDDPPRELAAALAAQGLPADAFLAPAPGETLAG